MDNITLNSPVVVLGLFYLLAQMATPVTNAIVTLITATRATDQEQNRVSQTNAETTNALVNTLSSFTKGFDALVERVAEGTKQLSQAITEQTLKTTGGLQNIETELTAHATWAMEADKGHIKYLSDIQAGIDNMPNLLDARLGKTDTLITEGNAAMLKKIDDFEKGQMQVAQGFITMHRAVDALKSLVDANVITIERKQDETPSIDPSSTPTPAGLESSERANDGAAVESA